MHELVAVALSTAAAELLPTEDWESAALCAQTDPESFFPERGESTREAKRVCMNCTVRVECLDFALSTGQQFGVWGGLSEFERRGLRRRGSVVAA